MPTKTKKRKLTMAKDLATGDRFKFGGVKYTILPEDSFSQTMSSGRIVLHALPDGTSPDKRGSWNDELRFSVPRETPFRLIK